MTRDQFEIDDDQNWSPNQLVTAGHDQTGHKSHKTLLCNKTKIRVKVLVLVSLIDHNLKNTNSIMMPY